MCTNLFQDSKQCKILGAKAAVDKEWAQHEILPAWQVTKVTSKEEVIKKARQVRRTVQFVAFMDLCHLKNSELEQQLQKCEGRVVLRGDVVKDDSGSYAAFREQSSSASQMTAANVLDTIATLSGCAGQANDAVSAYTQVKMEDAPTLSKLPSSLDSSTATPMAKSLENIQDPVVSLQRIQCGHSLAGLTWKRLTRSCFSQIRESTNMGMLTCASSARSISDRVRGRH